MATGGVTVCGIISCINNNNDGCGKLLSKNADSNISTTFRSINITMKNIANQNNLIMPITLAQNMLPLNASDFSFESANDKNTITYNMNLQKPRNDLLTFAIYGRNFDLDSSEVTVKNSK
jgi:hypothetical protein